VAEPKSAVTAPRGTRARLSTERILAAAMGLADRDGIAGLSMRRLADLLDVAPMAIYKHVANKDELLDRMVDVVFGEVELALEVGWRDALRRRALSKRAALLRHPWAIGLMEARTPGPANLRHHDEMVRCLRVSAGLSITQALHAYSLMDSYIYGFAFQQSSVVNGATEVAVGARALADGGALLPGHHPHLDELVAEVVRSGYDFDEEFEFGLDTLLDGIARIPRHEADSC